MNTQVLQVARKELLEMVREKRFLVRAVVILTMLGLLGGLVGGILFSDASPRMPRPSLAACIVNMDLAPAGALDELEKAGVATAPCASGAMAGARAGSVAVRIVLSRTATGETGSGEIEARVVSAPNPLRRAGAVRAANALEAYNTSLLRSRMSQLDPSVAPPTFEATDLATERQRRGNGLSFLVVTGVMILVCVVGITLFVDGVYGENERQTLEALFLACTSSVTGLLGKALRIVLVLAFLLSCLVLAMSLGRLLVNTEWTVETTVSTAQFLIAGLCLYAVTVLLLFMVTLCVSSAKQASYLANFLGLAVVAVAGLSSMGLLNPPTQQWGFAIPLVGSATLLRSLLLNGALPASSVIWSIAGSLLACVALAALLTRLFDGERLLYRKS